MTGIDDIICNEDRLLMVILMVWQVFMVYSNSNHCIIVNDMAGIDCQPCKYFGKQVVDTLSGFFLFPFLPPIENSD